MADRNCPEKRFILLGDTGAGKSAFINALHNFCNGTCDPKLVFERDQKYVKLVIPCKYWEDRTELPKNGHILERDINDPTKSQTMKCKSYRFEIKSQLSKSFIFHLIDSPGFNDTAGTHKDENNLNEIEKALQAVPYISGLIIVLNGALSRVGTSFQHFLRLLHEVWPNSLMKNVCAILTNCDDMSCNLKQDVLHQLFKVNRKTTFYIQNSLFNWDRKDRTEKIMRNLRRNFEECNETICKLLPILADFDNVSTSAFTVGAIKQHDIQGCIFRTIESMLDLIHINQRLQIAESGLDGAEGTMNDNRNRQKQKNITVFKWVEPPSSNLDLPHMGRGKPDSVHNSKANSGVSDSDIYAVPRRPHTACASGRFLCGRADETYPSTRDDSNVTHSLQRRQIHPYKGMQGGSYVDDRSSNGPIAYGRVEQLIKVTIDDSEAISHYETAQRQAASLQRQAEEANMIRDQLHESLNSLLGNLKTYVHEIRVINTDVDLLERNKQLLLAFHDEIKFSGSDRRMLDVFHHVVAILTELPHETDHRKRTST